MKIEKGKLIKNNDSANDELTEHQIQLKQQQLDKFKKRQNTESDTEIPRPKKQKATELAAHNSNKDEVHEPVDIEDQYITAISFPEVPYLNGKRTQPHLWLPTVLQINHINTEFLCLTGTKELINDMQKNISENLTPLLSGTQMNMFQFHVFSSKLSPTQHFLAVRADFLDLLVKMKKETSILRTQAHDALFKKVNEFYHGNDSYQVTKIRKNLEKEILGHQEDDVEQTQMKREAEVKEAKMATKLGRLNLMTCASSYLDTLSKYNPDDPEAIAALQEKSIELKTSETNFFNAHTNYKELFDAYIKKFGEAQPASQATQGLQKNSLFLAKSSSIQPLPIQSNNQSNKHSKKR